MEGFVFNPPPSWPAPPAGWVPPVGWEPDPRWPAAPDGWVLWVPVGKASSVDPVGGLASPPPPPPTVALPNPPPPGEVEALRALVALLQDQVRVANEGPMPPVGGVGVVDLDDERVLQEVGIYNYHHPVENSEEYRLRLRELQDRVKEFVTTGRAILASDMFTFNNSLAKGRKMTSDFSRLMLRAYNAEADNCVRSLRGGNVVTAIKRLESSVASIEKLGSMMEMRINPEYHSLRVEELELTADFQMKVQQEREDSRQERERLREERKAEQELAAERERLAKERAHYANALAALQTNGDASAVAEMEQRLHDLDHAIEVNDYRAANIRAGYVYVISNAGAFGRNMVKIGMTRRLEPMERIRELGDASVPFPFDLHALYFSDDAVTLENQLHHAFADCRVNRVNDRREFFFASPERVRLILVEKVGNLLEFTEHPDATEYVQSKKYWQPSPA